MDARPPTETRSGAGAVRLLITGSVALGILLDLVDVPELSSGPLVARWIAAVLDHPFRSSAGLGLLAIAVWPHRSPDATRSERSRSDERNLLD